VHRTAARTTALLVCLAGLVYAALGVYWMRGGHWLLDTLGSPLDSWFYPRELLVVLGLWLIILLKATAAPILLTLWWSRQPVQATTTRSRRYRTRPR
jgi:hypothetical protein